MVKKIITILRIKSFHVNINAHAVVLKLNILLIYQKGKKNKRIKHYKNTFVSAN